MKKIGTLVTSSLVVLLVALAPAPATPQSAPTAPMGYSVQSDSNTDVLYAINLATGAAAPLGPTGFGDVESLAFNPDCSTLYAVDDVKDRLITCSTATGACTAVGALGVDVTDTGLAFTSNGGLFMSTDAPKNPSNFYRLDPATGRATLIGVQGQEVTGLAANRNGLFGLGGDGRNNLVRIDPRTGRATQVGSLGAVATPDGGIDFDARGVLYGITDGGSTPNSPSQIFTVNPVTGAAQVVANVTSGGQTINGFEGLAIDDGICSVLIPKAAAIDAPTASEWALGSLAIALAFAGVFVLRRLF
ncbi:MAG TPA: DUF4394 domain-containing protein [Thermoanaerobaculia bacterium]|nr:DUF4394 domain-containing protein [Thermoanaerobaculia bacterium]